METADDVIRYLLAGADIVMSTAALVRHGRAYTAELVGGLQSWMVRKGFTSLEQVRGMMALPPVTDADAIERGGYVAAIQAAKERYGAL